MPNAIRIAFVAAALAIAAGAQQKPTPAAAPWWQLTTDLSNDAMQGRDTGTEAYQRAADYVAAHFKADGLKPAGDNGTYFQLVPMHQIDLDAQHSTVELLDSAGKLEPLRLLYETTLTPRAGLPPFTEGQLVFIGYGVPPPSIDLHGKIAVYFNNTPADLTPEKRASFNGSRVLTLAQSGVVGLVSIDNPAAIEPTHWPAAYARTVTITGQTPRPQTRNQTEAPIGLRVSFESAAKLFAGTTADPAKILADAEKGLPLPSMSLARKLRVTVKIAEKDIASPNVIAVLPGSDPALAPEYVAVSAHLDGYGYGTPVNGDNLYNGALDDAAYVATLLEMAHTLKGKAPARSLLFCIFTGEEKGLLGSVFYTQHLTVPKEKIVADLNLDQLRPIFPLKILTMEGIADSTIGDTAKTVAQQFNIELRPDRETERRLFSRSDNYSFVRIGVPIGSFIFGYDPNTEEERIYRDWYARRYHKPQDDLATPIDWPAAVTFNNFYRALALAIANAPSRPRWLATSQYAPKQ
jgi:hypothetical protein